MRHWLKYVRWDVIAGWRKRSPDAGGERRYPYAFGSQDPAFRAISGGVLWLVSAPRYGEYRLPPSLIARLHITEVVAADEAAARGVDPDVVRAGQWTAIADRDRSGYLPLNNAYQVLHQLWFAGGSSQLPREAPPLGPRVKGRGPYSHLPGYFQRHRVLTDGSVTTLRDYAQAVEKGRRIFLSYRWRDFTDDQNWLRELMGALTADAVSCWWDRWNVPQQDLARLEGLLGDILDDAVRQSVFLVALMRRGYFEPGPDPGKPTWVRREWDQARYRSTRRMTRVAVVFGDQPASRDWIEPGRDIVLAVPSGISAGDLSRRLISLLPS
jgi:TIR domain